MKKRILTTRITDTFSIHLMHEKKSKVITGEIEEIIAEIKWNIVPTYKHDDMVEFNFEFYGLSLTATIYDIDRGKYIYIDETIPSSDTHNWLIELDELNQLGYLNGIESISIDFTKNKIELNNYIHNY
jgi:hypothetical protein